MKSSRTLPLALAVCLSISPLASAQGGPPGSSQPAASTQKPAAAAAQKNPFDSGPPSPGEGATASNWSGFKLDKTKKVRLNFKNSSPDSVISFLSNATGITILKDPSLRDALTVTTASRVTLSDALSIFNTYLGLKNFQMVKQGNLLVIKPKDQGGGPGNGFPGGFDPSAIANMMNNNNPSVLKFYPIRYANAAEVARVINDVFAPVPGQQNNNPFQNFFNRGGFNGGGGGRFNRFGGGGGGAIQLNLGGQPGGDQNRTFQVKASSDDFSNSVIVNAPNQDQDQVATVIHEIDRQTDQPVEPQVFHLKYAVASDIAASVQNVLVATAPKGRGGQGNQTPNFGQQFGTALRFGSASAAFGNVVADSRTNSLVVTATKDNLANVQKLIDDLDKPVTVLDTTVVIPLKNAKADTVAQLLQNAFGNRQGVSGSGFNFNNTQNSRSNTNLSNRQGPSNAGGANGFGGADNLNDPNIPANASATTDPAAAALNLALQNPSADTNQILTTVGLQGFGGGGQGGGLFGRVLGGQGTSGGGSIPGAGTSRDPNGQIVPTRDLAGQITVIPDINSNQIIVVTPPDYVETVRRILAQLDKIPDQVVIETLIVEATLDKTNKFGVEWKFAQNKFFGNKNSSANGLTDFGLQTTNPLPQGFRYTVTGGSVGAFLNWLQTDVNFDVLSTPRIFTSNNQTAEINVSQRVPYIVSTRFDTNNNPTYTYGYENVGVVLTVTPRITAGGYVTLDVDQQDNDLQGYTSFNAPVINQREANTSVSVKDSQTLVLGGIIRDTVSATTNKIPLLGDLPVLGNLFKSSSKEKIRTELLIFLTPHIIRGVDAGDAYREQTIKDISPRVRESIDQILHLDTKQSAKPGTSGKAPDDKSKGSQS
jgi:general secretion pathway protein D